MVCVFCLRSEGGKVTPSVTLLSHLTEDGNRENRFSFCVYWFLPVLCCPRGKVLPQRPDSMVASSEMKPACLLEWLKSGLVYPTLWLSHIVVEAALESTVQQLSTLAWTPPPSSLPHDLLCLSSHLPYTLGFSRAGLFTVPQLTKPLLLLLPFSGGAITSHIHEAHFLTSFMFFFKRLLPGETLPTTLHSLFQVHHSHSVSLSSSSSWYYCYVTLAHGFICLLPVLLLEGKFK